MSVVKYSFRITSTAWFTGCPDESRIEFALQFIWTPSGPLIVKFWVGSTETTYGVGFNDCLNSEIEEYVEVLGRKISTSSLGSTLLD